MSEVSPIIVPQLNLNDKTVHVTHWLVEHGAAVNPGDAICEVETSKAVTELIAESGGVVFQISTPQSDVRVGERVGLLGPTLETIESYLSEEAVSQDMPNPGDSQSAPVKATRGAQALAKESGVALENVAAMDIRGTIKVRDVQRYLSERRTPEVVSEANAPVVLPPTLQNRVDDEGALSRHELSVTQSLRQSLQGMLFATIDAEVDLTLVNGGIRQAQEQGTMLSLLHVAICALGRALPSHPRLMSFHHSGRMYRYRQVDIAFVLRTSDARLYTPAVRRVDTLDLRQIARECHAAAIGVNRGRVKPEELEGACFTVSHIAAGSITRFVALPNQFQSAILAIAAERSKLTLRNGEISPQQVATLTLSYDHTLCDGMYAADFLDQLMKEMKLVFA